VTYWRRYLLTGALCALVGSCSEDHLPRAAGKISFPVFAECQPDVERLRELLRVGDSGGDLTVEKFMVPIESHLSLLGVANARLPDHPLLAVAPQEYLQLSVSSVLQSCMPNLGARIQVEGLGEKLRGAMPDHLYNAGRAYYAEIQGDEMRVFFNDGTYDYRQQNQLK
jgi:hypothetical protein